MLRNRTVKFEELVTVLQKENLFLHSFHTGTLEDFNKPETDSRKVQPGDVFICITGYQTDGHQYAINAIEKGAKLVITEKELPHIPQIVVTNSRKAAALIAGLYYQTEKQDIKLIGITGTNGKTTTSIMLFEMLKAQNKRVGLIGTLGYKILEDYYPLLHTTPDIIELHCILQQMKDAGIEYVIMEVSSHALALERVFGLLFQVAMFTNLTHDHLDFHKNVEDYALMKFKLFEQIAENGTAIINIDDMVGKKFYQNCKTAKTGLSIVNADVTISDIFLSSQKTEFSLSYKAKKEHFQIPFIGKHNIYNFGLAYLAFQTILPEFKQVILNSLLEQGFSVPGRLEFVQNNKKLAIYVDYAHTPDALKNVLQTLKPLAKKRLLCVFGAGGNRDKSKRPKMLEVALEYADFTIVTSDNPRFENENEIINDIIQKESFSRNFWIERNREKAIEIAVQLITEEDILLLAGKGHETYQIIGDKRIHFDDREKAQQAVKMQYFSDDNDLAIPIDSLNLEALFLQKIAPFPISFEHISTDSRTCKPNSIFFALKGENFDGHQFVEKVLQKENCLAVVEKSYPNNHPNLLFVDNTMIAYGKLAKKYQSLFPILTIAITGSMGKTTTKEFLYRILTSKSPTLKTAENENNQIGLPKTIFKLKPQHRFAIFEIGSNHFGEIACLTDICQPDFGVVTNIGAVHLEFFQDENGVFQEKSALLKGARQKIFFPADDTRFQQFRGIGFGQKEDSTYRLENINETENGFSFLVNGELFSIITIFKENIYNALIAIAIARELQIPSGEIRQVLEQPISLTLRMELVYRNGILYLADCYNANPQSMCAAIDTWQKIEPAKPHVAILGDMLELGKDTDKFHYQITELMSQSKFDTFISIGKLAKMYQADYHFPNVETYLESGMSSRFPTDSIVLLKASHGIHLEKIIEG
jgi:UDP-N-acetylmuramyl-tripeptide synthetase/UDP-N-acetylmuramoyl-tripeptide--D-alanyl-D-alanine ligase